MSTEDASSEGALRRLAGRQHGVVTRHQLRSVGASRGRIEHLVSTAGGGCPDPGSSSSLVPRRGASAGLPRGRGSRPRCGALAWLRGVALGSPHLPPVSAARARRARWQGSEGSPPGHPALHTRPPSETRCRAPRNPSHVTGADALRSVRRPPTRTTGESTRRRMGCPSGPSRPPLRMPRPAERARSGPGCDDAAAPGGTGIRLRPAGEQPRAAVPAAPSRRWTEPMDYQVVLGGEERIARVDAVDREAMLVVQIDGDRHHTALLDVQRDQRQDAALRASGGRWSVSPRTTSGTTRMGLWPGPIRSARGAQHLARRPDSPTSSNWLDFGGQEHAVLQPVRRVGTG